MHIYVDVDDGYFRLSVGKAYVISFFFCLFFPVGVDKIIRINLSTEGPVSPYIHERLSWYKTEWESSRSFETPPGHTWLEMVTETEYSTIFHSIPCSSMFFHDLPWPSMAFYEVLPSVPTSPSQQQNQRIIHTQTPKIILLIDGIYKREKLHGNNKGQALKPPLCSLTSPVTAASLAALSTCSFPLIPLWLGIHLTVTFRLGLEVD